MSLAYMYPANCRFLVSRLLSVTQLCSWHSQRRDRYITICAVQFATRCLPWILGQIELPMIVLESAHHEDSETPPTCLIWWSFGWDIRWPWSLNLMKNWLGYSRLKKRLDFWRVNKKLKSSQYLTSNIPAKTSSN